MTPCPRCRVPVVPQARFCSECGTWVVHAAAGLDPRGWSSMPPAPNAAVTPITEPVGLAGTLPASAAMLAALTFRDQPAVPTAGEMPATPIEITASRTADVLPRVEPPPKKIGATQVKTLDTGRPPPLGAEPSPREPARTPSKTVVDEHPPVAPSRSIGRTPRPLGAFLVSYQYEPLGTFWPLAIGTNVVGRAGAGRPDLDVGIADTTVSGEQALIEVDSRGVAVEDRRSRNGTSVNGVPVQPGVRVPIGHGDRVKFGSFETTLVVVPYPAGG